jgi:hypothetical protein
MYTKCNYSTPKANLKSFLVVEDQRLEEQMNQSINLLELVQTIHFYKNKMYALWKGEKRIKGLVGISFKGEPCFYKIFMYA